MNEILEVVQSTLTEGFVKEAGVSQEVAASMATEIVTMIDELEKSAMFPGATMGQWASHLAPMAAEAGAKALGPLIVGGLAGAAYLGAAKASDVHSQGANYKAFQAAVEKAINLNSILQRADRAKVGQMAESIFKYAPTAAADPHLLSSLLSQAVQMEGVDVQTIKMLVDLEKVHSGTQEPKHTFANFLR